MRISALAAIPYPWVVVGLCVMTVIPYALFRWGLGVLFPFIQDDLGTSRAELGLIVSGMFFGSSATALLVGWLVDVMGARRLQTAALVVATVGVLLFSQIQAPVQGVLLGILMGGAHSSVGPAFSKAIIDWVTPQSRGLALGIAEASIPLSGIIAAVLISFLAVSFGWRSAVMILALLIAVSSVLFFTLYRDRPGGLMDAPKQGRSDGRLRLVAKNRDIWVVAFYSLAITAVQSVLVAYLVLFLREFLDMSTVVAGACLAVAMAGGTVGRVGWGLVSDLLLNGRRALTLAIVGVVTTASMALLAWLPSDAPLLLVLAVSFVVGLNIIGWSGVRAVFVAELAGPALTGTAIGFSNTILMTGAFAFTPLFGLIVDRTGSYDTAWWMMAGVGFAGTATLAFLRPQARRS